jgi:lipoyl(octanoyl) transferase
LFILEPISKKTTKSNCIDSSGINSQWLGSVSYSVALELQNEIAKNLLADTSKKVQILGLEHPSVVTLGKQGSVQADILVDLQTLDDLNVQYYQVERGGHATLHNPGQLVIYPMANLNECNIGIKDYVCLLTKVTQKFFKTKNVETFFKENDPGLFTNEGKIAFFGLRVSRGITLHGLSINISNNLEDFSLIKSCGKEKENFDLLNRHLTEDLDLKKLFYEWTEIFKTGLTSHFQ